MWLVMASFLMNSELRILQLDELRFAIAKFAGGWMDGRRTRGVDEARPLEARKCRIFKTYKTSQPLPCKRFGHEPFVKEGLRDKSRTNLATPH